MSIEHEAVAADLFRAWREGTTVQAPSRAVDGFGKTDALIVAERLRAMRCSAGHRPAGFKVGFTNAAVRAQFGADGLLAATVYRETIHASPALRSRGLLGPRIEPEVVLGVGEDGVEWAAFGFEIVQSHVEDWKFTWVDAIADFGLHAALVIGEKRPFAQIDGDVLATMRVRLSRDGAVVERGAGSDVDGGALGSLAWLRGELVRGGLQLRPGDVVSTGSLTRVPAIAPGERWMVEAERGELPPLRLDIE